MDSQLSRPITAVASTVVALTLLGSRNLPAMEWGKQALTGGIAIWITDKAWNGDTAMEKWVNSPITSGVVFSAINKLVWASGDPWVTLFVGGAAIDVVSSVIKDPLSSALGL